MDCWLEMKRKACMAMKVRTIKHFIKEGITSVWLNRLMSVASICTVSATLMILGGFIMFSINLNYIGEQVQSYKEIQVFIDETKSESEKKQIGLKIEQIDYVKDSKFITKEQALKDYREKLGEKGNVLDGLEKDNPLRDSYMVSLVDIRFYDSVVRDLQKIEGIANIKSDRDVVDKLVKITSMLRVVMFWVMLLLSFIAIFIISNTIKLTVFARRKEINIMKYVGATNWFIRWPFILEGIIVGLIGCILALLLIGGSYKYIYDVISQTTFIFELKHYSTVMQMVMPVFISLGVGIGALGSVFAIRKYLRV